VVLSRALATGDTVRLVGARRDGHLLLSAELGANTRISSARLDAGLLWLLLLPGDVFPSASWPWITALWTAAWAAVIAYWSVLGGLRRRWLFLALLSGLVLPVGIAGPWPWYPEWGAVLLAALFVARTMQRRLSIARVA
jgi:hypothetical protein